MAQQQYHQNKNWQRLKKNQLQIAVAEQLLFFETDRKCNLKLRVKSISLQFEYN